jgi:hypothetical protein
MERWIRAEDVNRIKLAQNKISIAEFCDYVDEL